MWIAQTGLESETFDLMIVKHMVQGLLTIFAIRIASYRATDDVSHVYQYYRLLVVMSLIDLAAGKILGL